MPCPQLYINNTKKKLIKQKLQVVLKNQCPNSNYNNLKVAEIGMPTIQQQIAYLTAGFHVENKSRYTAHHNYEVLIS